MLIVKYISVKHVNHMRGKQHKYKSSSSFKLNNTQLNFHPLL